MFYREAVLKFDMLSMNFTLTVSPFLLDFYIKYIDIFYRLDIVTIILLQISRIFLQISILI